MHGFCHYFFVFVKKLSFFTPFLRCFLLFLSRFVAKIWQKQAKV